jgi:2-(1,2-epoxy-1,2-dihydrophenyl)acetyl-CoA isomerase
MSVLEIERRDAVMVLRMNRPERMNALSTELRNELADAWCEFRDSSTLEVAIFTGTGRAFCAGDDLKAYRGAELGGQPLVPDIPPGHDSGIGTYAGLRTISQQLNTVVRGIDKLTIAAINGIAIQTGFSLALSCDFRLAAAGARLGSATLRFGLLPDEGGQYLLVQHMGLARTMDFLMRKRIVSAEEAVGLGLVHEVVPADQLDAAAMALATELANGPQVSMRLLKRTLYNAAELTWNQALDDIAAKTAVSDHHPDAREGVTAFREKREPQFNAWLEQRRGE